MIGFLIPCIFVVALWRIGWVRRPLEQFNACFRASEDGVVVEIHQPGHPQLNLLFDPKTDRIDLWPRRLGPSARKAVEDDAREMQRLIDEQHAEDRAFMATLFEESGISEMELPDFDELFEEE